MKIVEAWRVMLSIAGADAKPFSVWMLESSAAEQMASVNAANKPNDAYLYYVEHGWLLGDGRMWFVLEPVDTSEDVLADGADWPPIDAGAPHDAGVLTLRVAHTATLPDGTVVVLPVGTTLEVL